MQVTVAIAAILPSCAQRARAVSSAGGAAAGRPPIQRMPNRTVLSVNEEELVYRLELSRLRLLAIRIRRTKSTGRRGSMPERITTYCR